MKKLIVLFAVVLLIAVGGCKKDEIQPSWWQKLWHKETVIMKDLNDKHNNIILPKIDQIRTTLDEYVMWDEDTIQVHGPGGYTPTSEKAFKVWLETYQMKLMPDTTVPCKTGELATIIKKYLDLRRKYDREKAFDKMWLCIPKEQYEWDSRFWEWFLSKTCDYLTVTLGGPDAWTDGTRQLWQEMEIYHLPTTGDPHDPWGCECSGAIRMTCAYLSYAEGPDKKMTSAAMQIVRPVNFEAQMEKMRYTNAKKLHDRFLDVKDPDFKIGSVDDYATKLVTDPETGEQFYVVGIPNVPIR